MKPELTRREMVVGSLGVAGALGAVLPDQARAAPKVSGDESTGQHELRVVAGLLQTERALEYAYGRVLKSWSFNAPTRDILELILSHEREHASALQRQAAALSSGLTPGAQAAARPSSSAMSDVVALLSDAHTPRDALRALTKVESLAEADYFNAVGELQAPGLVLTAAQILASEAQHWSLLLNVLTEGHLPQIVPDAFVRGVADVSTG